ncbi:hypothetical protein E0L93_09415 [Rubrobacter taiwanensis]|uniref:Cyclic-phosphate processing Receiver domain-containing protein n=1 Tax=Rubrobacter taiwanensis TaxID=185139 RepID=A0A4R1BI23_9ACTN|nr:cyclic-phosphate processing receiver domain-containing protein [Rubrobacter taiwanensis]TCJ16910.1 hypothetical protein E0L93_09415 [Rubrobacter taiwanensis]
MRVWLDDLRPAPGGWEWARTVEEAIISLLSENEVKEMSLDHDLGEGIEEGYALCLWMAEHGVWPTRRIAVHSANPPGAERMCGVIERYGTYRRAPGTKRFER